MARTLLTACALLAAVALAACGGSSGNAKADPTSVVPRDAAVYVEAYVRPDGDRLEGLRAAAAKILRTNDPDRRIRELVDQALRKADAEVSYERDIEPWLGQRAGVYLTEFSRDEPDALIVLAAKDTEKAEDSLAASAERDKEDRPRERTHRDVSYFVDSDGSAGAVIGDFVAFGDERQLKRAIDAAAGDSLADSDRYGRAIEDLDEDRIGHIFLDLRALFSGLARTRSSDPALAQLQQLLDVRNAPPVASAVLADGDAVALETVLPAKEGGGLLGRLLRLGAAEPTPLLAELPGDSWAALGVPKLGETARSIFNGVAGLIGGSVVRGRLQDELGLDLEQDVFAWMGDAALFVRGTSESTIDGALVVAVTDRERARRAVPKLVGLARQRAEVAFAPIRVAGAETAFAAPLGGAPRPLVVALGGERVVVAYGKQAAADALAPRTKLGDAPIHETARKATGGRDPSFLLNMPTLLKLLDSTGDHGADFEKARPYLDAISVIAAASERDGDKLRSRLAVGLK